MAFKPFEGSNVTKEFLPWCNEYYQKYPKHVGQCWDVTDIKQSDKGIIIECTDWAAWYWKSHKMHNFVLEFIKAWYASKKASPVMQLMLQSTAPYFAIGTDDERQARWGQTTVTHWHQGYNTAKDNPMLESNPLPLPSSSVQSTGELEELPHPSQAVADLPLEEARSSLNGKGHRKTSPNH
jgi:hypothetical protein